MKLSSRRRCISWGSLVVVLMVASCSKPSPVRQTMRDAGAAWDTLQKLVDKKGPAGGVGYAAQIGQLLTSDAITSSEMYKTHESYRDLNGQTIDELGVLEHAMAAGSVPETTGAIADTKVLCERCHGQSWSK